MPQTFEIAIDITASTLNKEIMNYLSGLERVTVHEGLPTSSQRAGSGPQMVILHTVERSSELTAKISMLRQKMPQTAILVISPDKSPEHVVEVMKAGADEFLSNPLNFDRLRNLVESFRKRVVSLMASKGKLYSFVSAKGGLGATVVSVNTAASLAMKNKDNVALLDMSLQSGDSSVYLDSQPNTTLADICKNFHRLDFSFLKTSMQHHSTGLHYLAAPKEPEDSGVILGTQVHKVLQLAKSLYDNVVVDCSSMLVDECSLETFKASDRIFLVTDLSVPAVRNAARLSQLLQKLAIPVQKIEVVVNRFIKGGASLSTVETSLRKKIFWLFPNDFGGVIASINEGVPLVKSKPGSPFSKSVSEFADKLMSPDKFANYRGAKGVLGKAL